MSIDERLEQKKLELYEKHRLDGCMSDEEVANEIRSLRSNKVRHQLLNDFKVQIKVPNINGKNYRYKNRKEMIDTFLEHRNEGFPRSYQRAAKKALNAKNYSKKIAKRAKKRAAEKASIVDNHPTFNTR